MTDGTVLGRWRLDDRVNTGDDYKTCQLWAQQLFAAGFTGIHYHARHDVSHRLSASVALFDDPGYQAAILKVLRSEAIPADIVEAGRRFHLLVLPETPLPPFAALEP